MNKLNELIQQFCPDGVEYKTLGEIATDIYRGSGIKREQVTVSGIPCVRYGEIYTTYGIWFDKCVSHTDVSLISGPKYFEHGDILFAITGESVEDIAKSCAYVGHEKCLAGGDIVVLKHAQNPKYLAYALSTLDARKQKSSGKVKSKVVHASVPSIKAIRVPLPPIEVQREIVRILDNFTELTAELTAELSARKRQYEYYRDKLLTFDVFGGGTNRLEWKTLGESIISLSTGLNPRQFFKLNTEDAKNYYVTIREIQNGTIVFSEKTDRINDEALSLCNNRSHLEVGDVLFSGTGTIGETAIVSEVPTNWNIKEGVYAIKPKRELLNSRYLMYLLRTRYMQLAISKKVAGGTVKSIPMGDMRKLQIPVPDITVQESIVSILDRFDALCNDLTSGLPAEIAARQKQYEFYRDKLLTFKERISI